MGNKTEIKKVNFSDADFFMGRDYAAFNEAVAGALVPARKNDVSDKLKSFLVERSGGNKAFLFESVGDAYAFLLNVLLNDGDKKGEILVLSKSLLRFFGTETDIRFDFKPVITNHLGNFIAALTERTRAVLTDFFDEENEPLFDKDFLKQICDICAARGILFIVDERKTFPSITGGFFGLNYYGIVPDAVIVGGKIYNAFSLCSLVVGKNVKTPAVKREIGTAATAGTFALYKGAEELTDSVNKKSKTLSDALSICKLVSGFSLIGLKGYATVGDGKTVAAELKEKGLKIAYSETRILFNIAPAISDEEFEFGLNALKEVLRGAQNPFDV